MYTPKNIEVDFLEPSYVFCTFECPDCHEDIRIRVSDLGYYSYYQMGELAQFALKELSVDEREVFISGICPKCWGDMFDE